MSYIEKLLEGVEVEWKTVDDIFHVKNGYTPSKQNNEFWSNGTIPSIFVSIISTPFTKVIKTIKEKFNINPI